MEEFHFIILLICKQQVLLYPNLSFVDANGLRDYIILHSPYNLVKEGMQSRERYFILPNQSLDDIPKDVENLYFCGYGNKVYWTVLDFSSIVFAQLRSLTISNNYFRNVREFVLDGLEKLERVKIGNECFIISDKERDDGVCRITNCPNLIQLVIGDRSFKDFNQFELSNVNSLQSIQFGYGCFYYAENCILKGE